MRDIIDVLFVIISTIIVLKTYRKLISFQNYSIAGFVILILYLFNCLPIILDIFVGIPNYAYYFQPFEEAAKNDTVSIIFDFYILAVLLSLYIYYNKASVQVLNTKLVYNDKYSKIYNILIWIPVFLFVFYLYTAEITEFIYGSFSSREVNSSLPAIINHSIFFSIYCFCIKYFGREKNKFTYFILMLYLIVISIINGKRFVIADILLLYFISFIYSNWAKKTQIKLNSLIIIVGVGFMWFMIFYITNVKIMGDIGFDYIYSQLRVDFGREDVTKYVIQTELNNKPILDYRGQSFLSMFLMIIPRVLWLTKPYSHYRYLTASIYGTDVDTLTSGITPSFFEMMLANFGFLGIPIAIILLLSIIRFGDKTRNTNQKIIVLLVIIQAFTQSMDVIMFIFYYFIYSYFKYLSAVKIKRFNGGK